MSMFFRLWVRAPRILIWSMGRVDFLRSNEAVGLTEQQTNIPCSCERDKDAVTRRGQALWTLWTLWSDVQLLASLIDNGQFEACATGQSGADQAVTSSLNKGIDSGRTDQ